MIRVLSLMSPALSTTPLIDPTADARSCWTPISSGNGASPYFAGESDDFRTGHGAIGPRSRRLGLGAEIAAAGGEGGRGGHRDLAGNRVRLIRQRLQRLAWWELELRATALRAAGFRKLPVERLLNQHAKSVIPGMIEEA